QPFAFQAGMRDREEPLVVIDDEAAPYHWISIAEHVAFHIPTSVARAARQASGQLMPAEARWSMVGLRQASSSVDGGRDVLSSRPGRSECSTDERNDCARERD